MSTTSLVRAIPVLPTTDLAATADWYSQQLDFEVVATFDDYLVIARDEIRLHFWLTANASLADDTACRIDVTGIDELYAEMNAKGIVHPAGHLTAHEWGLTDFHVFDNAGNDLRFQERTA